MVKCELPQKERKVPKGWGSSALIRSALCEARPAASWPGLHQSEVIEMAQYFVSSIGAGKWRFTGKVKLQDGSFTTYQADFSGEEDILPAVHEVAERVNFTRRTGAKAVGSLQELTGGET